ncbi:hypothetical protein [Actinomadura sp. 9N215]|uniref:hypothetical protein n=1 Tax=Actinomadura sp. 9N215 TaxID=3375150 RepID=UPI0037A90FDB
MSFERRRGDRDADRELGRETAEDLLAGVWRDPKTVTHPVAGLLAAATAPPSERELGGEDAAAAAFRQARLSARPRRGRGRRTLRPSLLEIATAKVIIALAVAGTAAGAAALAANTGHLPVLESPPHSPAPTSAPATATTSAPPSGQPRTSPPGASAAPGSPHSPAMAELCRSYLATKKTGRDKKSAPPPEFAPLIAAAGGPGKVAGYCAKVLPGEEQQKKPADPQKKKPKEPGKEKKEKKKKEKPGKKKKEKPKNARGNSGARH